MNSTLSLTELKDLIAYARAQRVNGLKLSGVEFVFHPAAFIDSAPEEEKPKAPVTPEAEYGHFKPE